MKTLGGLSLLLFALTCVAQEGATERFDHTIESSADPSAQLYLRERLPASKGAGDLDKAVLFVHGATYPGVTFDMPQAGYGWMTHTANHGYASYYLDIRGYGGSSRSDALDADPKANPPFSTAEEAVEDIADAVRFIRERTGVEKVSLIGWSWGTVTTGMFTASNNDLVDKLVLFAPVYSYQNQSWTSRLAHPDDPDQLNDVGAYRTVTFEQARDRWEVQIPEGEDKDSWRDGDVLAEWFQQMVDYEPGELVRAPNGVLIDLWEIFNARPIYDAAQITVPTLVIRGSNDPTATREDGLGLYDRLGSQVKRYVEVGRGTHFVSLERAAPQLIAETQLFLDDQQPMVTAQP